jgi:hypothetical protein
MTRTTLWFEAPQPYRAIFETQSNSYSLRVVPLRIPPPHKLNLFYFRQDMPAMSRSFFGSNRHTHDLCFNFERWGRTAVISAYRFGFGVRGERCVDGSQCKNQSICIGAERPRLRSYVVFTTLTIVTSFSESLLVQTTIFGFLETTRTRSNQRL